MKIDTKNKTIIFNGRKCFAVRSLKAGLMIALMVPFVTFSQTVTTGVIADNNIVARTGTVTLVENGFTPQAVTLSQNYPNLFNPSTKIQYSIKNAGMVSLKIFNLLGIEVAKLVGGYQEAGNYTVLFNSNQGILALSTGVYFYRLEAVNFIELKKLILIN